MHQLINGLVYADSSGEALRAARRGVFKPLVDGTVFDYFVTFDQDGRGVAGQDRWGSLPAAVRAEDEHGQQLIERGWESTVASYQNSFDRIQEFLDDHEVDEYWEDSEIHRQYALDFNRVGQFEGTATYLYDQDGEGIRDRDHLERVQNYWKDLDISSRYENLELYVVPADVHY